MSAEFVKFERTIRSELLSLLAVLLVPLGIISVFPYKAVGHKFNLPAQSQRAFASLVFLTEGEELEAIQRARSAWQTSNASARGLEIDLSMENLPEFDTSAVLENPVIQSRSRQFTSSLEQVPIGLPSLAAEAPDKIDSSPIMNGKFFRDDDLMKLK